MLGFEVKLLDVRLFSLSVAVLLFSLCILMSLSLSIAALQRLGAAPDINIESKTAGNESLNSVSAPMLRLSSRT